MIGAEFECSDDVQCLRTVEEGLLVHHDIAALAVVAPLLGERGEEKDGDGDGDEGEDETHAYLRGILSREEGR